MISSEEIEAINKAEKATQNKHISRKLRVLQLRYEGKSIAKIGELTQMTGTQVSRLVSEYRRDGLEEYIRVKGGGNHRSLSEEKEKEILARFEEQAKTGQVIRVQEIKEAFDQEIGKDTGRGYIYMLLARHGWRKVMPRARHPKKADDETITASKKLKKL